MYGLVVLSLAIGAAVAGPHATHIRAPHADCHEVVALSGTIHLSGRDPSVCITPNGKTSTLTIHNAGPGQILVQNSRNSMTLAAHSHLDTVFDSPTMLTVTRSASGHETDVTYDVIVGAP